MRIVLNCDDPELAQALIRQACLRSSSICLRTCVWGHGSVIWVHNITTASFSKHFQI